MKSSKPEIRNYAPKFTIRNSQFHLGKFESRNSKFEIPKPPLLMRNSQFDILACRSPNSKFKIRNSKLFLTTLTYMLILFLLSSLPGAGEGGRVMDLVSPTIANIAHVPAYGLLALLWIVTLRGYGLAERQSMWVAFLVASGYGALTELHQFWVPGRFPSIKDVLSNASGSLLFVGLYWQARRRFRISDFGLRIYKTKGYGRTDPEVEIGNPKF